MILNENYLAQCHCIGEAYNQDKYILLGFILEPLQVMFKVYF